MQLSSIKVKNISLLGIIVPLITFVIFLSCPVIAGNDSTSMVKPTRTIIIYYFHTKYRCHTCTQFEILTDEVITNEYSELIKNGELQFRVVNIEEKENKRFVSKYKLITKSIILSKSTNNEDEEWKNLEKIWEKVKDSQKFKDYVKQEIQTFLNS